MWRELTAGIAVPVTLHLDHCPDREFIGACLRKGWNSVLFDGSSLPVEENLRQTLEVVAEARSHGAHVEGEIEAITGVEDGIGSDEEARRQSLPLALEFIRATGVDVFAPRSAMPTVSTTPSPSSTRSGCPTSSPRSRCRSPCTAGRA
jgi:fructose/tagatose bisphosphate aldolase